uniref:Uncharacterized protein n=1 Tax=Arundo donax TaxID=35708 RepID=A0A0A9BJL3_ARUDO
MQHAARCTQPHVGSTLLLALAGGTFFFWRNPGSSPGQLPLYWGLYHYATSVFASRMDMSQHKANWEGKQGITRILWDRRGGAYWRRHERTFTGHKYRS